MTRRSLGARTRYLLPCLLAVLSLTSGCMRVEFTKPTWPCWPSWLETAPEGPAKGPVVTVVPLWLDGLVVQPDPGSNGAMMPGFAGKIYLIGPDDRNVEAEGIVTIQLYDDQQAPTNPPTPRETWTVAPEVLKTSLKRDMVGWYYNLWLPWTYYQSSVSQVTLVVQHQDKTGRAVWSKPQQLLVQDQYGPRKPSHVSVSEQQQKPGDK